MILTEHSLLFIIGGIMEKFAKVFDSEDFGQIVLIMQSADETGKPELRVFFKPESLGVCSLTLSYSDTDEGWDNCESNFNNADLEFTEGLVKPILEQISECL
jgi:hypothetical protein